MEREFPGIVEFHIREIETMETLSNSGVVLERWNKETGEWDELLKSEDDSEAERKSYLTLLPFSVPEVAVAQSATVQAEVSHTVVT